MKYASITSEERGLWTSEILKTSSTDVCLYYMSQDLTWLPVSQKVHKWKYWPG